MSSKEKLEYFKIPNNWEYRGEGNCNVVLALPELKKVIRIRKVNKARTFLEWIIFLILDFIAWFFGTDLLNEHRDLSFYSEIMKPLLGAKYVSNAKQVVLSRKQIKNIERALEKERPHSRRHKSLKYGRASIFDDLVTLQTDYIPYKLSSDTYAIEIKPKQGWLPFSERKYFPQCIFCLNQFVKKNENKISKIGKYCPENLFSGDFDKMVSAITELTICPQNNFAIFKNGKHCYGQESQEFVFDNFLKEFYQSDSYSLESLREDFCLLMFKCLTKSFENEPSNWCKSKLFCEGDKIIQNFQSYSLPKGCVLEKILSAQMLDAEGTQYYKKLLTNRSSQWGYVAQILKEIKKFDGTCLKCAIMTMSNSENVTHPDMVFAPYLISAVAKDCSLMITLRKIVEDEVDDLGMKNIVKCKYGYFVVNVTVFDLYPKPMSTINKHDKRNKLMLNAYKNVAT